MGIADGGCWAAGGGITEGGALVVTVGDGSPVSSVLVAPEPLADSGFPFRTTLGVAEPERGAAFHAAANPASARCTS